MPDNYPIYDDSNPYYLEDPGYTETVDVTAPYLYNSTIPQGITGAQQGLSPELLQILAQNHPEMIGPQLDTQLDMPPGSENPKGQAIDALIQQMKPRDQNGYADISSLLGAYTQGEKANRAQLQSAAQNYDQLALAAQRGRNETESDALKKLAQTKYILGGGSHFNFGGNPYTYGGPPRPPSEAQKAGATALQAQLLGRLAPGGTVSPTPLAKYGTPGKAEKVANYGALAAGGLGAVDMLMKARNAGEGSGIDWGSVAGKVAGWFGK